MVLLSGIWHCVGFFCFLLVLVLQAEVTLYTNVRKSEATERCTEKIPEPYVLLHNSKPTSKTKHSHVAALYNHCFLLFPSIYSSSYILNYNEISIVFTANNQTMKHKLQINVPVIFSYAIVFQYHPTCFNFPCYMYLLSVYRKCRA